MPARSSMDPAPVTASCPLSNPPGRPIRSPRAVLLRSGALLALLVFALGSVGCAGGKPRERWWQFWRPRAVAAVEDGMPPPMDYPGAPGIEPLGEFGESSGIDDFDPNMGAELPEIEPVRKPAHLADGLMPVYFGFDSDRLDDANRMTLDNNAQFILGQGGVEVLIEGHCDERGTVEYNLSLGQRRANAVKAYLIQRGVPANLLHTISYGEERPIDPGSSEESWGRNRRAQFLVY